MKRHHDHSQSITLLTELHQSQQTLKLDEAVTRMRLLEKQDAVLRDSNAVIATRNGELEDLVVRLQEKLTAAKRQHKVETEWYQPRIAAV